MGVTQASPAMPEGLSAWIDAEAKAARETRGQGVQAAQAD